MSNGPWTDEENDLIVADYFAMLADDVSGRPYNKAEHRRGLLPLLNDRSEGSVEFKHQNISAVLKGLGEDWIPGYKPAFNFQMTLLDAVARLQPGVLNDAASHAQDSFSDGLLDCPHYSRPERLGDAADGAVPSVLLSGHHAQIARWRRERQLELTARRRPDLIVAARAAGRLTGADEQYLRSLAL